MDWVKAFQTVDLGMAAGVAAIAAWLEYSQVITDKWAVILTLILAAVVGIAAGQAKALADGTGLAYNIIYQTVLNMAAAAVIGRPAAMALRAVWKTTDGKSITGP